MAHPSSKVEGDQFRDAIDSLYAIEDSGIVPLPFGEELWRAPMPRVYDGTNHVAWRRIDEAAIWRTIIGATVGEVFLGFYVKRSAVDTRQFHVTVRVTIGGTVLRDIRITTANLFTFAVEDQTIIPIICIRFHVVEVEVVSASGAVSLDSHPAEYLSVLCLFLSDNDMRRNWCQRGTFYMMREHLGPGDASRCLEFRGGMMTSYSCSNMPLDFDERDVARIPDLKAGIEEKRLVAAEQARRRCHARCLLIMEELMQRTWHPQRMTRWCLAHDDAYFTLPGARTDAPAATPSFPRMAVGETILAAGNSHRVHDIDARPHVMDAFLRPEQCAGIIGALGPRLAGRPVSASPRIMSVSSGILQLVAERLEECVRGPWHICSSRDGQNVVYGNTSRGLHIHRDEAYLGDGTMTLLVYLTSCGQGGETVFLHDDSCELARVRPQAGRAVLFGNRVLHYVEPVISTLAGEEKYIVTFEVRRSHHG